MQLAFQIVHLSVSKTRFVAGGNAPYLEDYVEEGRFICDITQVQYQAQHVLDSDGFEPSRRIWYRFLLIAGDERGQCIL